MLRFFILFALAYSQAALCSDTSNKTTDALTKINATNANVVIKDLLDDNSLDPQAIDNFGNNLLMKIASFDNIDLDLFKQLLDYNFNYNATNIAGETAYHRITSPERAEELFKKTKEINIKDKEENTHYTMH